MSLRGLLVLCALFTLTEAHRVFNKIETSADPVGSAAGRKLRGCKKAFANPLYQPILAYNAPRAHGPQLNLPSTGWYDLADVALGGSWDQVIQSISVGEGGLCVLWKDQLSTGAAAKSPPLVLGAGYLPVMPKGWSKSIRTVYALRRQSKEPAFTGNIANLIGVLRDGYGSDPAPPKLNPQLTSAADNFAGYLFKQNKLTETGPKGGVKLADRLKTAGYGPHKAAAQLILRVKTQDPGTIFNAFLASAKNLKIMLSDYNEIGTGWGWNGNPKNYIYICVVLAKK